MDRGVPADEEADAKRFRGGGIIGLASRSGVTIRETRPEVNRREEHRILHGGRCRLNREALDGASTQRRVVSNVRDARGKLDEHGSGECAMPFQVV